MFSPSLILRFNSSPPPSKRLKPSPVTTESVPTINTQAAVPSASAPTPVPPRLPLDTAPPPAAPPPASVFISAATAAPSLTTTSSSAAAPTINPRKRRSSRSPKLDTLPPGTSLPSEPVPGAVAASTATGASASVSIPALLSEDPVKRRGRTNTPWTAAEEQRLKQMRDAGHSWGTIAKAFPNRTEGSVKKHWYKDMHYAEFAEDESAALRDAIKEYEANKWKAIGAKLGKPAKACEQYAREHFKTV